MIWKPTLSKGILKLFTGEVKDHLRFITALITMKYFLKFLSFYRKRRFKYAVYLMPIKLKAHIESTSVAPKFMSTATTFCSLFDLNVICYIEQAEDHKPLSTGASDRISIFPVKTDVEYQIFTPRKSTNVTKCFTKASLNLRSYLGPNQRYRSRFSPANRSFTYSHQLHSCLNCLANFRLCPW
jgi:hypothetical protein